MLLMVLPCIHIPSGMQETIGDLLGDDELEEMRLRENEEAGQGNRNGSSAPLAPANTAGQPAKPPKEQEQQPAKALQPPPGFSANHLFGDVEDDDPLDLVTNLSFLNDNEEVQPMHMDRLLMYARLPKNGNALQTCHCVVLRVCYWGTF